ncbi:PAP/25A associated domain containing protein [Aphelenchoides avenae]|nr:PAP/25A associated domain containing protein [Aphelenchus avenae]
MSVVMQQRKDVSDMSSAMSTSSSEVDDNGLDEAEAGSSGCADGWTSPYPPQSSPSPTVPWAQRRYAPTLQSLHEEVVDLWRWLRPTPLETELRDQAYWRVYDALEKHFKCNNAQFWIFGSVAMGLYLPTSDIDITMHFEGSTNIQVIDKTSVPVVKFTDSRTRFNIDMSINTQRSQRVVEWVEVRKLEFPSLEPLVLVLKQLLTECSLNEPFKGGLSSYALILMVVHFLKAQPLGPLELGDHSLGLILLRFLEFYGLLFDYVNYGLRFGERAEYVKKDDLAKEIGEEKATSFLFIKDPLQDDNNVGKGAHCMFQVKTLFAQTVNVLHSVFYHCNVNTDRRLIFKHYYGPMLSLVVKASQVAEQRLWLESVVAVNGFDEAMVTNQCAWSATQAPNIVCTSVSNVSMNSFVPLPPVCSPVMVPMSVFGPPAQPPPLLPYSVVASPDYVPANRQVVPEEPTSSAPRCSSVKTDGEAVNGTGACTSPMLPPGLPCNGLMLGPSPPPQYTLPNHISTTSVPVTFRPLPPQPVHFPTSATFPPLPAATPPLHLSLPQACGSAKPPIQTSSNCFVQMSVKTECTNVSSGMPSLMQTSATATAASIMKTATIDNNAQRLSGPVTPCTSSR